MLTRRVKVEGGELRAGVDAVLAEVGVPRGFPDEVTRAAAEAGDRLERERVEIPFFTVDPPGSLDLDQAMHIERRGEGWRVSYAIADVGALVVAGSALDAEAHERGVTVYAPDAKAPLYPQALSEGSGSLLPGVWRPAILWTIDLDASGAQSGVDVRRAEVRSEAQHTYENLPAEPAELLRQVGELRSALERERGGVSPRVPEQEVVSDGADGWTTRYRAPLASEDHNAQISLLTGMAAAGLMLGAGTGILRTQEAPGERSFARFRLQAAALGHPWPEEVPYDEFVRSLDASEPRSAALLQEAAGIGNAARYVPFNGDPPADLADRFHFSIAADYAHATAPLRRLQDRYVSECCLAAAAGDLVPSWVLDGLDALPELMGEANRRAGAVERGVIDLVEALLLRDRVGETFHATVVDERMLQIADPAVRTRVEGDCAEPGAEVSARLTAADPATRRVSFEVAS